MQFHTLRLQNFFSHRDTTIALANRGLVLIAGAVRGVAASSSGAGKSSLLPEGLLYALFGRTMRGATASEIVRQGSTGGCMITLTGVDRVGREFTLVRTVANPEQAKDSFTVEGATFHGRDAVNAQVANLLGGVGFEAFCAGLVFGKGDAKYFTQLTDAQRKAILGELVGFGDLDKLLSTTNRHIGIADEELTSVGVQRQIAQARRGLLETTIRDMRPQAEAFEAQQRQRAMILQDAVRQITARLTELDHEETAIVPTTLRDEAKAHVTRCTGDLERAHEALRAQDVQLVEVQRELKDEERNQKILERRIEELESLSDTPCPVCEQPIPHEHVQGITVALGGRVRTSQEHRQYLLRLVKHHQRLRAKLARMCEEAKIDVDHAIDAAQQAEALLSGQDAAQKARKTERKELQRRHKSAVEALQQLQEEPNVAATTIAGAQTQLATCIAEMQDLDASTGVLTARREGLLYWQKAFGLTGIRSMLLDSVTPFLNEAAKRYSEWLTDGTIRVSFSSQSTTKRGELRDRFAVEVQVEDGATSWTTASDGQRRRADIIATLALGDLATARIGGHLGLLILDEIFDGLDGVGLERAALVLQRLTAERQSVFVITHHEAMAQYFPSMITIAWERGVSWLRDGSNDDVPTCPTHEASRATPTGKQAS